MKLYLVRHGRSEGNEDKSKYFEMLDSEIGLVAEGRTQAKDAAHKIMSLHDRYNPHFIGNMFHSPYKRACTTADIIESVVNGNVRSYFKKRIVDIRLREREWGGLRDIVNNGRKTEGHFNFFYKPTDGESFANCYDRVASFHQWLMMNHGDVDAIVVAHGEFNKLYAMYLMRWSIEDFDKWRTPRNGEVMLFNDGVLDARTPLSLKPIKN